MSPQSKQKSKRRMKFVSMLLKRPRLLFVWLAEHGWFTHMDDEKYLRLFYRAKMGRTLHLDPPVTLNEKVQWLKLHDRDPLHCKLVDKAAVRGYIAEMIGAEYLIPMLGVWDDPDEIDFSELPERFVLKCTHNSGGAIVCADKAAFDEARARKELKRQLKRNYYTVGREWLYKDVPRRVLAEAFIGSEEGVLPADYKFFCFNGVARALIVCLNRVGNRVNSYYFDRDFQLFPIQRTTIEKPADFIIEKPPHFEQMLGLAEKLSRGMPYVRIDLYDTPDGIRFGEFTFFGKSGFEYLYTEEGDRIMGGFLKLEEKQ